MKCDICGRDFSNAEPSIFDQTKSGPKIYCRNCFSLLKKCETCEIASTPCSFLTADLNIPFEIEKQFSNGSCQIVTKIRNPDRIRETCQKGCPCFDSNFGCLRQNNGTCKNFKFIFD